VPKILAKIYKSIKNGQIISSIVKVMILKAQNVKISKKYYLKIN
jgi:hypothetical protein